MSVFSERTSQQLQLHFHFGHTSPLTFISILTCSFFSSLVTFLDGQPKRLKLINFHAAFFFLFPPGSVWFTNKNTKRQKRVKQTDRLLVLSDAGRSRPCAFVLFSASHRFTFHISLQSHPDVVAASCVHFSQRALQRDTFLWKIS